MQTDLGVRRAGVTAGALNLQQLGLIRYWRGHIRVLDRRGLESRACECHAVVKREYERLLPEAVIANASAAGNARNKAPAAVSAHTGDFGSPPLRRDQRVEVLVSAQ